MSQGGAADVVLGGADRLGDGPCQGRLVARPHAVGVVVQRGGLLHHAGEVGEPRVRGVDGEPGLCQQDVLAQRLRDRLAGGTVAYGGDECCFQVVVLVEDQGFLAGEVLEQGGHRDVGGVGDVLDADLVVAAVEEEFECGVGQGLAGLGLLALAAPGRFGHSPTIPRGEVTAKV